MSLDPLSRLLARLVPAGVRISSGFDSDEAAPLARHEVGQSMSVDTARTREFALGRRHARRALHALGCDDAAPLPRRRDGRPEWPDAVIGSISHTTANGRVFAVSAVARRDVLATLGIDVEAPGRIAARHWPTLLTAAELARVLTLAPADRSQEVFNLWCAKEAVAKAVRPGCELEAIAIDHDPHTAGFVARWPASPPPSEARATCSGRVLHQAGWTCAVAAQAATGATLAWPDTAGGAG